MQNQAIPLEDKQIPPVPGTHWGLHEAGEHNWLGHTPLFSNVQEVLAQQGCFKVPV